VSAGLPSSGDTPVKFTMAHGCRHAAFEGVFGDGEGAGRFTSPHLSYASDLAPWHQSSKEIDDEAAHSLAVMDVSRQFIRDMQLPATASRSTNSPFRIHGVPPSSCGR